jgi:hypothetical protein
MAGYERNPKLHRRMAALLAIGETLALTANFCLVFMAYGNFMDARLDRIVSQAGVLLLTIVATVVCLVALVLVSRRFIKGSPWARWVLVVSNVVVIVLGVMWYLRVLSSGRPDRQVGIYGLMLPMVTLFPLLWPLLVFKPRSESPAGAPAAPVPEARPPAVRLPPSTRPPEP